MGFSQGLSGLNTSSRALDVISHNIANTSTVGFKASRAIFADVYAGALTGVNSSIQIGYGSKITAVYQSFVDGIPTTTANPLDMAIIGNGFYVIQRFDGSIAYTRNGQFDINKDGYIITPLGEKVMGVLADENGAIPISGGAVNPLFVPLGDNPPKATTSMEIRSGNLNADDPPANAVISTPDGNSLTVNVAVGTSVTSNWSVTLDYDATTQTFTVPPGYTLTPATVNPLNPSAVYTLSNGTDTINFTVRGADTAVDGAVTVKAVAFQPNDLDTYNYMCPIAVYDSLGGEHLMELFFVKTGPLNWDVYTRLDGDVATLDGPVSLTYGPNGKLTSNGQYDYQATNLINSAANLDISVDLSSLTQYGSKYAITDYGQDGYSTGQIAGLTVSQDGIIQGLYTNGQTKNLGQVVLATFRSNQGLTSVGDNMWVESPDSGPPIVGRPRTGLNGLISGGQVEESNVDLTQELVNMIIQQRNYQANAQTIRTQDQIMQTLVNLR